MSKLPSPSFRVKRMDELVPGDMVYAGCDGQSSWITYWVHSDSTEIEEEFKAYGTSWSDESTYVTIVARVGAYLYFFAPGNPAVQEKVFASSQDGSRCSRVVVLG